MNSAAELLEGRTLKNGWLVKRKMPSAHNNSQLTGGCFSVGYEVEKDGHKAFLKALDFSRALAANQLNPAGTLSIATGAFVFEKEMLELCQKANIKKVVKLLDDGVETVCEADAPKKTQYLIFEWAESDVRKEAANSKIFDHAWALKCMHGVTSGLYNLHKEQIIHQDIKPSNILLFEYDDVKIGDLGRSYRGTHAEVDHNKNNRFPGDMTYAPLECLYGYHTGSDEDIRKGADVYMLGSMLHFFFTGIPLTPKIFQELPPEFHYKKQRWERDQIVPYLQKTYDTVVEEFSKSVHKKLRNKISEILRQLTYPLPEKRGHPAAHRSQGSNLSLERYVSIFDNISFQYLIQIKNTK